MVVEYEKNLALKGGAAQKTKGSPIKKKFSVRTV
jgi:hypothetical protein